MTVGVTSLCASCGREPARLEVSWPDGHRDEVCPGCRPPRGRGKVRKLDGAPGLVLPAWEAERLGLALQFTGAAGWRLVPAPPAALDLLEDLVDRAALDVDLVVDVPTYDAGSAS